MIGALTLVPPLVWMAAAMRRDALRAFVHVGLPLLLVLPNYYTWKIPGVPRFDFHNYLLLAALVGVVLGAHRGKLRAHPIDLLPLLFLALVVASELSNKGFHEARNLFVLTGMGIVAPYWIGKALAADERSTLALVACLALVGAIIGLVSPWEARMGSNPFDALRGRWHGPVPWDGALYRAGLRRVAGPFAHPICHGFFFSMSLPLTFWLVSTKLSSGKPQRWGLLGAHGAGLLLSLSRGPILGCIVAFWILALGWCRSRAFFLAGTALLGLAALVPLYDKVSGYVGIERGEAVTETQETAAYRQEMLQNYMEVVWERPGLGFGKDQIPVVKGQKSIDNQYLFLTLTHGLPAAFCFLLLLVLPILASLAYLVGVPRSSMRARLQWTLVGVLCGAILTQVTVFSGTQTTQVLMLLVGLTVGLCGRREA